MAKKPKQESQLLTAVENMREEIAQIVPHCHNCIHSDTYRERLVCKVPLPPHVATTGAIPFVNTHFVCPLHKWK